VRGDEVHVSLLKVSLLGLGRSRLIRVPAERQGCMRYGELPQLDEGTLVCIQAWNVNAARSIEIWRALTIDSWAIECHKG
jgi:hypothetical protein